LHRHLEKKELEVTKGVEDHVKFVAVALNTALETVRSKGESALLMRRGEGRVQCDTMSIYAVEEEKSVWKFVEPGVMGVVLL
jgi:hypothetical protein